LEVVAKSCPPNLTGADVSVLCADAYSIAQREHIAKLHEMADGLRVQISSPTKVAWDILQNLTQFPRRSFFITKTWVKGLLFADWREFSVTILYFAFMSVQYCITNSHSFKLIHSVSFLSALCNRWLSKHARAQEMRMH
jgi:SpoVK/Ycf46/Vps4 family AAA+-type ATPase